MAKEKMLWREEDKVELMTGGFGFALMLLPINSF